ncbi:hypothetical protein ACTFIY_008728 [Dictyostelium cf. discoideum]
MENNNNILENNEENHSKQKQKQKQKQKENVNSFNKIIKLTITDNIEPTEILFWKLFRNKVIYKNIFSFMDKQFSINYDSMSSIENLIENNQFNIIKEKVYRNCRYLHSTAIYYELEHALFFVKLFSNIKVDYKFYRNFLNSDNCYYNSYSTLSKALILSKKFEIYKLYINEFNHKPTKKDLFYSIIIGSNKFIKYILELNTPKSSILRSFFFKYKRLLYKNSQNNIFKSHYPIKKIKIFKGLLCFLNIIGDSDYKGYEINHHQIAIDYLIASFTKNPHDFSIDSHFKKNPILKTLITICKLILLLKKSINNEITLINNDGDGLQIKRQSLRESFKSITATITIKEIDNFIIEKIDKQTLKSKLDDPINYNNSNEEVKCFIKKLLDLYQSTFKYIPIDLYLCYYYGYGDYGILDSNAIKGDKHKAAFKFANFQLLKGEYLHINQLLPNNLGNFTFEPNWRNNPVVKNYIVLFSHCFDQEKKIKFIDQLIERNTNKQELDFENHFFYMLIMHGDIELLEYFSNKVGTTSFNFHSNKNQIIPPTYYIESIEMLEYLFNNHRDYFIDLQFPNGYCTFFKSLQLLQHFESLLIQYKSNNPSIIIEKDPISFIRYKFEFIISDDYIDFVNHFITNSPYNNDKFEYDQLISIQLQQQHYTNKGKDQTEPPPFTIENNGIYSMKFLKFVDSEITGNHINSELYRDDDRYHFLFATDRYDLDDDNNNNNTINSYYYFEDVSFISRLFSLMILVNRHTPYLYEVNNFKFLNWFLTKIKNYYYYSPNTTPTQKSKIRDILHEFMSSTIHYSRLIILEYIHQYYDFIFKKETDGGILTSDNLKSYLDSTIDSGSIKVSEFLSQFITFPKYKLEFSKKKLKIYFSTNLIKNNNNNNLKKR